MNDFLARLQNGGLLFDGSMGALIEARGGKVTGSVTGKTTCLINNDSTSNSAKNRKAKELNVPVLTEEEFMKQYLDMMEV